MKSGKAPDKAVVLKFLKKYGIITLGCIIYSLGVSLFLDASNLASGGVTGISIMINCVIRVCTGYELSTGLIILIINVPLFILGAVFFGKHFLISTVYATILSSALMWLFNLIFAAYLPLPCDLLLTSLIGGALFGCGMGLIFRMGSSTGGTDVIVKILRKKFRYIQTGMISMAIDLVIVGTSALVYWALGMENFFEITCYTFISIVVFSTMFDFVLYGGNSAKLVYIITTQDNAQAMCAKILKDLDVGATFVDGEGAYTGDQKRIIMCAVKNFLYPKLRDIVSSVDANAFMIVSSAKEIYGEGYKNHLDDEL
ncbi:MAG: YitT family protein [Clostridia bacterium]|nr:YitT family protein [Clostridia bacterium]